MKFQTDHFQHLQFPFTATENDVYQEEDYGEEEDLGYYEDGVKRTLSDEQVKIFRHSEIHALLRERQRLREEQEEEEEEEYKKEIEALPDNSLVNEDQKAGSVETDINKRNATDTETAETSVEREENTLRQAYSGRKMVSYSDD